MKFIFLALLVVSIFSMRSKTEALFSVSESNVKLNGPSVNNFKGHVGLDDQNRGIIITAHDGLQNESLLRLVSEKLETDTYLIDYRLMRSCNLEVNETSDNKMRVKFSPQSLENRNKNDKFDITVDILNTDNFKPKDMDKNSDFGVYMKTQCEKRKKIIFERKQDFSATVDQYKKLYQEFDRVKKELYNQQQEVESIKSAIEDAETQMRDINSLKDSYQMQMKSIASLTTGANKLISKEGERSKDLVTKEDKLKARIQDNSKKIKAKEDGLNRLKETVHSTIERSKDVENLIITLQKDLSEVDNNLSNLRSTKLGLDYELKAARLQRDQIRKTIESTNAEIETLSKKNYENKNKSEKAVTEKTELDKAIDSEKEEIKKLEERVNELIKEKSKKEVSMKEKYDRLKIKDEEIVNIRLESDQINNSIKRLKDGLEKIESGEKKEVRSKIGQLKEKISKIETNEKELSTRQNKLKLSLEDKNKTKEILQHELNENNKSMDQINKEISEMTTKKIEQEKKLNEIDNELKDKSRKLSNLRSESKNYDEEKKSIKRSLAIASENYETFKSILNDFTSKLAPVEEVYKTMLEKKIKLEKEIKEDKNKIKDIAKELRKETPSARIMIDMAEDDALGNEITENPKWRLLIDRIIH